MIVSQFRGGFAIVSQFTTPPNGRTQLKIFRAPRWKTSSNFIKINVNLIALVGFSGGNCRCCPNARYSPANCQRGQERSPQPSSLFLLPPSDQRFLYPPPSSFMDSSTLSSTVTLFQVKGRSGEESLTMSIFSSLLLRSTIRASGKEGGSGTHDYIPSLRFL